MAHKQVRITGARVWDIRHPTALSLNGSDPFHVAPCYSAAYLVLETDAGLNGVALVFTIGAGTEVQVKAVESLLPLVQGLSLEEFTKEPGAFWRRLNNHHQRRWLGDGVQRMAFGCLVNALWDLWAKAEGKPLWKLLVELTPEQVVEAIDWRYLTDALEPEAALDMLRDQLRFRMARQNALGYRGPRAYCTAAWTHLQDEEMSARVKAAVAQGISDIKAKVGLSLEDDRRRLEIIRRLLGRDGIIRVDSNQLFGVPDGIEYMTQLAEFGITWWEEPTHPSDILGYKAIKDALAPHRIGLACGEHCPNMVVFKQLMACGAIDYCQIDATRMGGVNEVLAVILLAAKFGIPVCPHGGGIGLCNMIPHFAIWDEIAVSGPNPKRVVEYIDFLHGGHVFVAPVVVKNGHYVLPQAPGWGIEMQPEFLAQHRFPNGVAWNGNHHVTEVGYKF